MEESVQDQISKYVKQYSAILSVEIGDNFLKGDIADQVYALAEVEVKEKGKTSIISDFLNHTGESKSTFIQHRWIARKFKDENLRALPGLSWTHYRAAAGTKDPESWITKAHDEHWSIATLQAKIDEARDEVKIDSGITCICGAGVERDSSLTVTWERRRTILCSLSCGISWLEAEKAKELEAEMSAKDQDPFEPDQPQEILQLV